MPASDRIDNFTVRPGHDLGIKFADRPKLVAAHMKVEGKIDRAMVLMPVVCDSGPKNIFLGLSHSKNEDGTPVQQAVYIANGDEKAFIGTANDGAGALFPLIDGEYQRLDLEMLERHVRENPFFGETIYSPE